VCLAEGVPAADQGHGFLVVHAHPAERDSDVMRRCGRVMQYTARALGVHLYQPHLNRAQSAFKCLSRFFGVLFRPPVPLLVREPFVFLTPVDVLFGFPDVHPAASESEWLETHVLDGAITGEHHQVGPRDLLALLLLNRPQ